MPGEAIQFDMIVGLGNPGGEHEQQRHNAGFWYLDELARELGVTFTSDKKSFSQTAKAQLNGRTLHLVKPYNYMNNSGQGFSAVARFFKIDINKILVAHDELDMPPGHIRLKQGGGHGGHNGLRDIVAKTGSKDFWRLRIGIGHPGHKSKVSGYVLNRASSVDQRLIDESIDLAIRETQTLLDGDINVARKNLHSHKPDEPKNGL